MKKITNTLLFVALGYVAPLLGAPALLLHYKALLLMAGATAIFLTQPTLHLEEAREEQQRDRNSVFLILLLSLASAAAPVIDWAYWHPERHHDPAFIGGLLTMIAGIGLRAWSINVLGTAFTPTVQISQEQQLVQEGPYSMVRHPSYLGALLALIGGAIVLESWIGLVLCCCFMGMAYAIRIRLEEKALVEAFGQQYITYQEKTARLIPYIW
ncbi:MAG: isoprenylcysteine carboxylmethyltransferase family protein [Phaeodactylibacter sp.]|nr:isoprenylcysteine carboxylmethyltransferase family protein [Phaeodactylibacter sp.]